MPWKKLSAKTAYKSRYMEVTEDSIETTSGKRMKFGVVHKQPGAIVIPWDGKYFTLVGQYRYPVNKFLWEFPMGHFEHKNILETARKELKEETGLSAKKIVRIGTLYTAPGHNTQISHIFLATMLSEGEPEREESEEGMRTKKVTMKDLQKMLADGKIKDCSTLAAFAILRLKKLP